VGLSSRGRFATPAEDCSPYSHVHVRRECLGFAHRSGTVFLSPRAKILTLGFATCASLYTTRREPRRTLVGALLNRITKSCASISSPLAFSPRVSEGLLPTTAHDWNGAVWWKTPHTGRGGNQLTASLTPLTCTFHSHTAVGKLFLWYVWALPPVLASYRL
jgi:hypothetical protein